MLCLGAPGLGTTCCGSSGLRGLTSHSTVLIIFRLILQTIIIALTAFKLLVRMNTPQMLVNYYYRQHGLILTALLTIASQLFPEPDIKFSRNCVQRVHNNTSTSLTTTLCNMVAPHGE